jgi:hypothetical protein
MYSPLTDQCSKHEGKLNKKQVLYEFIFRYVIVKVKLSLCFCCLTEHHAMKS